ncbi:hypothetical protein [Acidicapsa ligni]|uniref:hypothetical protein n=1 Tax=Acidicapsa ligni TaxID=542300 RepID=UPI0021E0418F|nr:hypothetical protein [Acidicapsa ligni]
MIEPLALNNQVQLWVMATLAFAIFYSNYMVAPLLPAFLKEFAAPAYQLGWLIAGYLIPYGVSTLAFGFSTALAIFASIQTLLGFAALYGFRGERPSRARSVELTTT